MTLYIISNAHKSLIIYLLLDESFFRERYTIQLTKIRSNIVELI